MNPSNRRRLVLHSGFALGLTLATRSARACEYFAPHLRITHPWSRASETGATTAVLCMKFDEVTQADRLIALQTPVASGAVLAGPMGNAALNYFIAQGQESLLSEGGVHILLTGLRQPLELARTYPLKLVFDKGGVVDATISVDYTSHRFK